MPPLPASSYVVSILMALICAAAAAAASSTSDSSTRHPLLSMLSLAATSSTVRTSIGIVTHHHRHSHSSIISQSGAPTMALRVAAAAAAADLELRSSTQPAVIDVATTTTGIASMVGPPQFATHPNRNGAVSSGRTSRSSSIVLDVGMPLSAESMRTTAAAAAAAVSAAADAGGAAASLVAGQVSAGNGSQSQFGTNATTVNVSFFPGPMAFVHRSAVDAPLNVDSYYGVDIHIVRAVAKQMQFQPNLVQPADRLGYGYKIDATAAAIGSPDDEQFTGALGDLLAGRTDIIGNMFFVRDYGSDQLRFTAALFVDRLCIVVRAAELVPDWWLFVNIFDAAVWSTLAFSLVAASLAYWPIHHASCYMARNYRRHRYASRYERFSHAVASALRLAGTMLSRQERGFARSAAERVLLLVCLWHSIVISGIFQGQLYNVYTHPRTVANVNTIDELASSNLHLAIRFRGIARDVLGDEREPTTPALRRLREKVVYVPADSSVYETVLRQPHMADIDRVMNYQLVAPKYRRADGRSRVHVLEEYPKYVRA